MKTGLVLVDNRTVEYADCKAHLKSHVSVHPLPAFALAGLTKSGICPRRTLSAVRLPAAGSTTSTQPINVFHNNFSTLRIMTWFVGWRSMVPSGFARLHMLATLLASRLATPASKDWLSRTNGLRRYMKTEVRNMLMTTSHTSIGIMAYGCRPMRQIPSTSETEVTGEMDPATPMAARVTKMVIVLSSHK